MTTPRAWQQMVITAVLAGAVGCRCTKNEGSTETSGGQASAVGAPAKSQGENGTGAQAPVPPAAVPVGSGTISGEVVVTGTPPVMQPLKRGSDPVCAKTAMNDESALVAGGKLENAVVRIAQGAPPAPAPAQPVVVEQKDCTYRPRVQAAVAGQPVAIRNDDGTLHNVHTYNGSKTLFNQAQPPHSPPLEKKFDEGAAVVKFKCDVHPWMTGYVVVNANPYIAVTTASGAFELKNVPTGTYGLEVWHEKFGVKKAEVTVKNGETAKVTFTYSADDRG